MTQLPPSRSSREFLDRLASVVGAEHVLVGSEATAAYTTDWTRRFHGPSAAVVRPANVTDVADVVRVCGEFAVAIVMGIAFGAVVKGQPVSVFTEARQTAEATIRSAFLG